MERTILLKAPLIISPVDRFCPIYEKYALEPVFPKMRERMEDDLLKYAGQLDGVVCGDDHYSQRVHEACSPRLKIISKWKTDIDSIYAETCSHYGIKISRTLNAFTTPVDDTVPGYLLIFSRC